MQIEDLRPGMLIRIPYMTASSYPSSQVIVFEWAAPRWNGTVIGGLLTGETNRDYVTSRRPLALQTLVPREYYEAILRLA